jgi:uncharacterized membrane protein
MGLARHYPLVLSGGFILLQTATAGCNKGEDPAASSSRAVQAAAASTVVARATLSSHAINESFHRPAVSEPLPVLTPDAQEPLPAAGDGGSAHDRTFEVEVDAEPDIGRAPLTVRFTAAPDDDSTGPFSFAWDFGDGERDSSNPTAHTYRTSGTYTAVVTVTNAQGQQVTRDAQLLVDPQFDDADAQ